MTATTIAVPTRHEAQDERTCRACGHSLRPRHRSFCSDPCRKAWWEAEHPRINRGPEGRRPGRLKDQILAFLREHPGEHTEQQIADAIHGFSHSVGARLSELRRANEPIEVRRGPGQIRLYKWVK